MRLLLIGGTGFIGTNLVDELLTNGHEVIIVTRKINDNHNIIYKAVTLIEWDLNNKGLLPEGLECDAIINLAGESIGNKRWTIATKEKILNSRINSTRGIIESIKKMIVKPKLLINASAIGYYGTKDDEFLLEESPSGNDFLAQVCKAWEEQAYKAEELGVRVVTIRIGVVLGNEGALKRMLIPFKFYMGGPIGSGQQWLSWIHIKDLTKIFIHILENNNIKGAVNAVSPQPVRMKDFSKLLGTVMGKPAWVRTPSLVLKIVLGEMSILVLEGQKVLPDKLIKTGFKYNFENLKDALEDIKSSN